MDVLRVSVTPVRIAEESALGTYVSRFWFEQHGVVSTRIRSIFHSVLHSLTIRQWLFGNITPCALQAHYIFFAFLWSRAAMAT